MCASGVSHALISTPAAALTHVYIHIYIYKRINTPYAPDLNPPPPRSPPYVFVFPSTRRSAVSPPSSRLSRSLRITRCSLAAAAAAIATTTTTVEHPSLHWNVVSTTATLHHRRNYPLGKIYTRIYKYKYI